MKRRLPSAARLSFPLASAIAALLAAPSLHAANGNWNVDAAGNWSAAANWSSNPTVPGTVAGDVIGLNNNISAARIVTIDTTARTAGILNVGDSNNTHAFTLAASGGATLTLNNNGSGAQINELGSQVDVISAPIILADNLAVSAGGSITLSTGGISETGGARTLTKSGTGILTLSGANSYTGLTTISAGVLNIQNGTALGTAAGGTTVASGAALQIQNNITVGAEALSLSGEGISSVVTSLNGTGFASSGALRNISGNNTYGGAITLATASRINSDAGTLTLTGGITGTNLDLTFGGGGNTTVSTTGITTGSGSLTKDNFGTLTLSAANSYSGATKVLGGTLAIANEAALYNGNPSSWTAANINVKPGGTLALSVDSAGISGFTETNLNTLLGNIAVANTAAEGLQANANIGIDTTNAGGSFTPTAAIANSTGASGGAVGLIKLGTGTLVLGLANTYTGTTFISAGTLQLGNGGTTGSLSTSSSIRNNGTLTINRSNAVAQGTDFSAAPIIGTGAFIQAGTGTTTLNAANTFTGTTTISGGVLNLTNARALQNSVLVTTGAGNLNLTGLTTVTLGGLSGATGDLATVISSGYTGIVTNLTLNPASGVTNTYGGVIANGGMTLTKTGLGTQILSGVNTYTGTTTIREGTLTIGNGTTGSINGTAGTALTFTGTGTFNVAEAAGSTQGMGALTLSAGDGTVTSTAAGATSAATLTFDSLATRSAGATANFTLAVNTTSTGGTPNKIVFTNLANVPLAGGSNNAGLFFGGANYARYDAAGFVRAVGYGTDTNANASLSGNAVTTLGATTNVTDTQFTGAARATTTSGAVSGTNTNTLAVTNGALFAVGQILTGTNIAANTYIAGISGNTLTLANAGGINAIGGTAVAAGTTLTPYNAVTAQTSASVNTLNLSGIGASLTLSSAQTLSINGILRSAGTAAASSVISGGTGIQTAASGGDMVVRTNLSTDVLTIATPILDNGGSSLTKSGAGTLLLSGANTYAGGTFLNGGTVVISNANSFGANAGLVTVNANSRINAIGGITYANPITVNAGQTLTLQNPTNAPGPAFSTATFSGVISGSGDLFLANSGTNAIQGILAFTNANNTFTGNVVLSASGSGDEHFKFNSLGDAGNFTFAKNGNRQLITYTGSSNLTFNSRQIVIADTMFGTTDRQGMDGGGSNPVNIISNDGSGTVSFTQDMVVGNFATNYGVLYFGGTNLGDNTFSGNISDTSGSSRFAIGKFGTGKWILTGTNTFEGNILIAGGTLSVGTIANANVPQPLGIGPAIQLGVGGGNANGTLLYTGGTASTNKQVQIGAVGNAPGSTGAGSIVNDGGGALTFTNPTFNPATTGVTGSRTLTLGGSYTGAANEIQGVIQNNAAGGLVNLAKSDAGTWVLSATNTYTGSTTVNGGVLQLGVNNAINSASAVTVNSNTAGATATFNLNGFGVAVPSLTFGGTGATATSTNEVVGAGVGSILTLNGAVTYTNTNNPLGATISTTTLDLNNGTRTFTIGDSTNTTAELSISSTIQNGSLTKAGAGTMVLSGTNSYTGATSVTAGVLAVNGTLANTTTTVSGTGTLQGSGSIAGSVTIGNGGTLASGNSIESLATGALSFTTGSTFQYELDKDAAPTVAGDLTAVTGDLSLDGTVTLSLVELGSGAWELGTPAGDPLGSPAADKLTLIGYTGSWNGGLFTYLGSSVLDDSTISLNGQLWRFNYNDTAPGTNSAGDLLGGMSYVTMTVPEPGAALLGGLGLLALLRRRR